MARKKPQQGSSNIGLPYNFNARPYQWNVFDAVVNKGIKRAVCVWHRRAGKDKVFMNILMSMIGKHSQQGGRGTYYYFLPTYNQGKKIIWDGMDKGGFKFIDHIPEDLILRKNETEMKIELITHDIIQIIGTDNYDSIMGTNPIGCVFSEYSLQDPKAWDYISPILLENKGWAIFNGTPRGNNHLKKMFEMARIDPDWFCERLTVEDTRDFDGNRYITEEDIESERRRGLSERLIKQEYYCEFVDSGLEMLIPFEIIKEAMHRNIEYQYGMKIAGLDCARKGEDDNALVVRMGGQVTHIEKWSTAGVDNPTTFSAQIMMDRFSRKLFDVACVDSIGYGGGVADLLRSKGKFDVYDVNVAESSSDSLRFARLRDEAWWNVREWFYDRKCSIPDIKNRELLIDDLSEIYYDFVKGSEKIKVCSKADLKELIERSPDVGDAFMHTFAIPIDDKANIQHNSKILHQHFADNYYDPFENRGYMQ